MKFDNMASAYKRALHFGAGISDGPFCALRSPIGNNYARMLSGEPLGDLLTFDAWAGGLNRLADGCRVMDDAPLREAFASFASMLWLDPRKLTGGAHVVS